MSFTYESLAQDHRLRRTASDRTMSSHEKMIQAGLVKQGLLNKELNRYSNILPYDRNLARCSLGYINASLVSFPEAEYIIAAGPMAEDFYGPDTRTAFWATAVENNVNVMVGLTRFKPGFSECADYLQPRRYGNWKLHVKTTETVGNITKRELELVNDQTQPPLAKLITHFHFTAWPNYSVASPVEACALLRLADEAWDGTGRMMVHCSGGIGRSGTFVAAHRTYRCRPSKEDIPQAIFETVVKLREDRHPWMVEGPEQFELIHRIIANL